MQSDPNPLANVHFERNRVTRGDWDDFASHRKRVTELILSAIRSEHPSLCILGAGNGNDLDLERLAEKFTKITLVDLDPQALEHCLASQGDASAARIETVSGVDLSGILESLSEVDEETLRRAAHPPRLDLALHDVVVSTCLLTQIIDSVATAIGPNHAQFVNLVLSLRDAHLRQLCDLTAARGTALLITDFVSSDTVPQLAYVPEEHLESLLAQAINDRNFFLGVNPRVLEQQFGLISGGSADVELHRPWRWEMGNRTYAVCAVSMRKRG